MRRFLFVVSLILLSMAFMITISQSGEEQKPKKEEQAKVKTPEPLKKTYTAPTTPYVMDKNPHLIIETDLGNMEMELFLKESPMTATNFLYLVREHYYDGLIWHRVIPDFVIQGGDPLGTGMGGPGYMIKFEVNDKKHNPGAIAMARSSDPNSAGSQFYVALKSLPNLDKMGYCVFGQLVSGLDIAQKIAAVKRDQRYKPLEPVHIVKIYEKNSFMK